MSKVSGMQFGQHGGDKQTGVRGTSDLFVASACTYEKELSKPHFSYSYSGKNNTSLAGLCQGLRNNAGDCLPWPMLFKWGFLATDGRSQSNLRKGTPGEGGAPRTFTLVCLLRVGASVNTGIFRD